MTAPARLRVGPFTYDVVVGGRAWDEVRLAEGNPDLMGHHRPTLLSIVVAPDLATGAEREVLLHEVLHACLNAAGQPLDDMDPKTAEENAVRVLAPTLLAALRDNAELVAYLLGPE